jgi:hypothetical protein
MGSDDCPSVRPPTHRQVERQGREGRQGRERRTGCDGLIVTVLHARGHLHQSIACTAIIAMAALVGGCTRDQLPAAPTPLPPPTVVLPAPGPADVTLTGRITEAPPTSTTGVWDATVTLDDGVNAWQSARTIGGVGRGEYTIPGLHAGRFRARVSAGGFVGVTQNVTVGSDSPIDFQLLPTAAIKSIMVSDHLSEHDGTCSDGTQMRPCHIVALPIHNSGWIDATVTWPVAGPLLTLILFESGSPVPLATSTSIVDGSRHLVTNVEGGAVYEIRVIYASGTGTVSYSLSIAYPN